MRNFGAGKFRLFEKGARALSKEGLGIPPSLCLSFVIGGIVDEPVA